MSKDGGCCDHDHGHSHSHHHHHHQHQHQHQHSHHHHEDDCCSHDHNQLHFYKPEPRKPKVFDIQKEFELDGVTYMQYKDETQMPYIMDLITKDLSEPYSIYTYRYFIHNWPHLSFLALDNGKYVGVIVCKLDTYKDILRGYIAMLAVDSEHRRKKIGSNLVSTAIKSMCMYGADEVVLETELSNKAALRLYENLGFVRDKRLFRYYLNGVDAFRLKLWLK